MVNFIDYSDTFQRASTKRTGRPEEEQPTSIKRACIPSGIADTTFGLFYSQTHDLPPLLGHVSLLEDLSEPTIRTEWFSYKIAGTTFIIEKRFEGSKDLKKDKIYFKKSKQLYYEGESSYGIPHGQGVMTLNNKRNEGTFVDGLFIRGLSTLNFENGDQYDGSFADGNPNGKGTYTFIDGSIYQGQFVAGKFHGSGIFTTPEGDHYSGDHKDGLKHGKGIYHYPNGDKYEGEFRKGKRNGQGVYTFADGRKYDVNFRNNKPHGFGIYTALDGKQYCQKWHKGKLISK